MKRVGTFDNCIDVPPSGLLMLRGYSTESILESNSSDSGKELGRCVEDSASIRFDCICFKQTNQDWE
jgi:hypothetical protein